MQLEPVLRRVHKLRERRRQQALCEIPSPVRVGPPAQIDPREVKEIEAIEDDWDVLVGCGDFPVRLQLNAILQRAERRLAARIERHDFSVEDHAADGLITQLRAQSGKYRGELQASPGTQLHACFVDEGEHPIAVKLGFPHPVRVVERSVAQFGLHRCELCRHGFEFPRRNESGCGNAMHRMCLEILHRHPAEHGAILRGDVGLLRVTILVLDEEPVLLVRATDERKRAFHLFAAEQETELALVETFPDPPLGLGPIVEPELVSFVWRIDAAIPDDHLTRAVLPWRDDALERPVVVRVIFCLHGEAFFARIEGRSLGNRPRLEHAVALEAKVVVQAARGVLLNDEEEGSGARFDRGRSRFRGGLERPFGGVFAKRHRRCGATRLCALGPRRRSRHRGFLSKAKRAGSRGNPGA